MRLAIIVSHPIQYYAPLHQRLALRSDLTIKVFFTWHDGHGAVQDRGFGRPVAWDIPLTEGYEFELVPNSASDPGTHHFFGLRNPSLVESILAWRPDAVHVTGWGWLSHLLALRAFRTQGLVTLFRGDSHLLDATPVCPHRPIKQALLRRVFSWPNAFLVVGQANREYYRAFGVPEERLYPCPHSIDVRRFAEPADLLELEASRWRQQLDVPADRCTLLFAGKFERKKRPLELMRTVLELPDRRAVLIMLGGGELEHEVRALAASHPDRFRVLQFQNQSRMPVVYRLADLFVLPSAFGETWGLAVNEALSCGRPVLVSSRVGCAMDVVDESCGQVFAWDDRGALAAALNRLTKDRERLLEMGNAAAKRAWAFDVTLTEAALVSCVADVCK